MILTNKHYIKKNLISFNSEFRNRGLEIIEGYYAQFTKSEKTDLANFILGLINNEVFTDLQELGRLNNARSLLLAK